MAGRGQGVENNRVRRLEDGVLPILHTMQTDGDIEYSTTTFVTLENSKLEKDTPIGTNYLVADSSSYGHMFTPAQKDSLKLYAEGRIKKTGRDCSIFQGSCKEQIFSAQVCLVQNITAGFRMVGKNKIQL